jgi:hypothetical protein
MSHAIPCTVQILTRNNADNLEQCLQALSSFDEVIVHDGYSADGTRDIAQKYPNVRLMDQNRTYLDSDGRIIDFAAMRNESLKAAKHDWIFMVDADEQVDSDLVAEIGEIVKRNQPGVYQVFRRFYVNGEKIIFCSGYPVYQIRFYHRSLTEGYVKVIHERLALNPGVKVQTLKAELPTPLPPWRELQPKFDRYLAMEVKRLGLMSWGRWIRWTLLRNLRSVLGLSVRLLWIWLIPRMGKRLPLAYELQYIRHSLRTIVHTFPLVTKKI